MKIGLFLRGTAAVALVLFSSSRAMDTRSGGQPIALGVTEDVYHFFPASLVGGLRKSIAFPDPLPESKSYTDTYDLVDACTSEDLQTAIRVAHRDIFSTTKDPVCCGFPLWNGTDACYYLKCDSVSIEFAKEIQAAARKITTSKENNPIFYLAFFLFYYLPVDASISVRLARCEAFLREYHEGHSLIAPFVEAYQRACHLGATSSEDEKAGPEAPLFGDTQGLRRRAVRPAIKNPS